MKAANFLRDRAYAHIHSRMMAGDLEPGSQVSELALAREIGISRTPVREALRRLQHEGLVEAVPRFGTVVRAPDRRELEELYEMREALEAFAAARAAERIGDEDLAALQTLVDDMASVATELRKSGGHTLEGAALKRFLAADMGFHLRLFQVAGNRRILKSVVESRLLTGIFGARRQDHTLEVLQEAGRFHGKIVAALRRRDAREAGRLVRDHVRHSKQGALEHLDRREARALPAGMPGDLLRELDRIERKEPRP